MATETGPDLTFARQQVELLMDDTCRVVRPATTDTLDGAPVVYAGRCTVSDRATLAQAGDGDDGYRFPHNASLPAAEADGVVEGDVLVVLSSRRDPTLVDRTYVVRHVKRSTFLVSRQLGMVRYEPDRRPWHDEEGPGW